MYPSVNTPLASIAVKRILRGDDSFPGPLRCQNILSSDLARVGQESTMAISMLVVDDEIRCYSDLKGRRRKAGLQRPIEICRGGAVAFASLLLRSRSASIGAETHPLVSDLQMPVMRGTELVARLRGELGPRNSPRLVLSSSDAIGDIEDALSSGANGYQQQLKCESKADYLDVVRWLDECCRQIECGCSLTGRNGFFEKPAVSSYRGASGLPKLSLNAEVQRRTSSRGRQSGQLKQNFVPRLP